MSLGFPLCRNVYPGHISEFPFITKGGSLAQKEPVGIDPVSPTKALEERRICMSFTVEVVVHRRRVNPTSVGYHLAGQIEFLLHILQSTGNRIIHQKTP